MTLLMFLGVLVSAGTSVYAAEEFSNTTIIKENNEQEIANELEFLFDKASSEKDGVVFVNEIMLKQRYGGKLGNAVAEGIRTLYDQEKIVLIKFIDFKKKVLGLTAW